MLIPDYLEPAATARYIRKIAKRLFDQELAAWMLDESTWPTPRNYRTFKRWFEVEVYEIVLDAAGGPIVHDVTSTAFDGRSE